MPTYEYGRAIRLDRELAKAGVAQDVIDQVLAGGEAIGKRSSQERKAAWLAEAMRRLDDLVDMETRRKVREACACSLTGNMGRASRELGKQGGSLEERIAAVNAARPQFGESIVLEEDGRIFVRFQAEGQESYYCGCLPGAKERLSITYCYCCGGFVKEHFRRILGRKVEVETLSSLLASGGTEPCTFRLTVVE